MSKPVNTSKVASTRLVYLAGIVNSEIVRLPVVCVRKSTVRKANITESKIIKNKKTEVLGMVSHPGLYKSETSRYVNAWCHPFRNPDDYLDPKKPRLLLSESDFVDKRYVEIRGKRKPEDCNYDGFCFTMGGRKMARRKGFSLFLKMLPVFKELNLKIALINYTSKPLYYENNHEKNMWESYYPHCIYYEKRKLTPRQTARMMARSKFGIFPNEMDCSPLLLVESILRDTPVMVNEKILGGWKYVNKDTGLFFNRKNIKKMTERMVRRIDRDSFDAREYFTSNHGFKMASTELAEFGREHFKGFKGCKMACFEGLSHLLRKYR